MGLFDKFRKKELHIQDTQVQKPTQKYQPVYDSTDEPIQHISTKTEVAVVRRASDNKVIINKNILPIKLISNSGDGQTLLIQYPKRHMFSTIRSVVSKYKHKSAESFMDEFRHADIFVNMDRLNGTSGNMRDKNWLRIIYECLEDNPSPGSKFSDAMIIRIVDEYIDCGFTESNEPSRINGRAMTLDMFIEGR